MNNPPRSWVAQSSASKATRRLTKRDWWESGSYRINERKDAAPRLSLQFDDGELNFYTCSVQFVDEPLDSVYDWRADVMSDSWDSALARKRLRAQPESFVCDALLDQNVFSGVGNIIKNEVLYRVRVHPLSTIGALPAAKLREVVEQARIYSFDFLEWKREFTLKQHWLAHRKYTCSRCNIPLAKQKLGATMRQSYYCGNCQRYYGAAKPLDAKVIVEDLSSARAPRRATGSAARKSSKVAKAKKAARRTD